MGDYARRKKAADADTATVGAPGMEAFWAGVAIGATQSLVDPRVPGKAADPTAMLPYIDRDHDDDPVATAAKVTAQLTESTKRATTFTKVQSHVDALVAGMGKTDERDGRFEILNTLDRLDDPKVRDMVLAKFHARTGRSLSDVIATSEWYGGRDEAQALALISPARATTQREIAAMSPAERAKLTSDARKTATEIAGLVGRGTADDKASAQKIQRALAGKTPAQIEAIRAAVREQTRGNESLYEQLDRSMSGGHEDEAIASLTGDPVYAASVALQNASGDAPRITEILRALPPDQVAALKQRFPAATLVWMSVPADQRAEIGALVNGQKDAADGARVADLLRDPSAGVQLDGIQLDEQSKHNRETRSTDNVLRELSKMSATQLASARAEWDASAAKRGEKTWDAMIEERFGSGDPLVFARIRALASGNKIDATALALQQGVRDHDQALVEESLANPDLSSKDAAKRAAAREHARAVAERFQHHGTAKAQAIAAMQGDDVSAARGDSLDTALAKHTAHQAATQRYDSASDVTGTMLDPDAQARQRKKRARATEVGTNELREHGSFSMATEIHRARIAGDEKRVATILDSQADKRAVNNIDADYYLKYGEELFKQGDPEKVAAYRQLQSLRGVELTREQAAYKLRDSHENRVHAIHELGPQAVRSTHEEVELAHREHEHQTSDSLSTNDLVRTMAFGHAAGSEQHVDWSLQNMADAADGPREEFDQHAAHFRAMSDVQREEKIAMGERAAQWLAIAGKLAALATLNPAAMAFIDGVVGIATIAIRTEIEGESYKTADTDLLATAVTVGTDLAMLPITRIQNAMLRAAYSLGVSSTSIMTHNSVAGRDSATAIDLLRNLFLSLVVSRFGDKLEDSLGGALGKGANIATNTLAGGAVNGSEGVDLLSEGLDSSNGVVAKRPRTPRSNAGSFSQQDHDDVTTLGELRQRRAARTPDSEPDPSLDAHIAELESKLRIHDGAPEHAERRQAIEAHLPMARRPHPHMHPAERARREAYYAEHGHTGSDLHSHFMGVASVDDFAKQMGGEGAPLSREHMLEKMVVAVRNDKDYAKHYSVDESGAKVFDDTGAGIDPIKGGHAFDNVFAIEKAKARIDELRKQPPTPAIDAEIREIATRAVDTAMNSSQHTPYDGGYSIRDTMVKAYVDKQPTDGSVNPYRNFTRMTLEALARDGVLYSEQSQSVKKLKTGNVPYAVVREELERFNDERAARGEPPIDLRFLAMIETRFLGAEGSPSAGTDDDWTKQLDSARELVKRGDVMGVDFASPETSDMGRGGKQLASRFEQLALMLSEEGKSAGRKLTLRPHVGEGYIEMPEDPATGNRGLFDRDHSDTHYDKARSNLGALIANVDRLARTMGADGKPIYDPENPAFEIRFGHATHATPEQAAEMKRLGIKVEVNLGSNAISGSLQDSKTAPKGRSHEGHLHHMDDHSLLTLAGNGVEIHLATDAQAVMRTRLELEHQRAANIISAFRGQPENGVVSKHTMPVTRDVFLAQRPDVDPTNATGPYVLSYAQLPDDMKRNIDTAHARMIEASMQRQSQVDADDARDTRRNGVVR
jgi:hypothetical protein